MLFHIITLRENVRIGMKVSEKSSTEDKADFFHFFKTAFFLYLSLFRICTSKIYGLKDTKQLLASLIVVLP